MGRPKTYDREQALRRAMGLFWRKGYEGTHLQELVSEVGINRFSLYKEFGGKEGLFREAVELYLAELGDLWDLLMREPLGIDNILAEFRAETRDRFQHGCLALNTLAQKHVVPEDIFASAQKLVADIERGFLLNLKAAQESGELDPAFDANGLAKTITALNVGLLTYEIHSPAKTARRTVIRTLEQLLRARSTA